MDTAAGLEEEEAVAGQEEVEAEEVVKSGRLPKSEEVVMAVEAEAVGPLVGAVATEVEAENSSRLRSSMEEAAVMVEVVADGLQEAEAADGPQEVGVAKPRPSRYRKLMGVATAAAAAVVAAAGDSVDPEDLHSLTHSHVHTHKHPIHAEPEMMEVS